MQQRAVLVVQNMLELADKILNQQLCGLSVTGFYCLKDVRDIWL